MAIQRKKRNNWVWNEIVRNPRGYNFMEYWVIMTGDPPGSIRNLGFILPDPNY